MEKGLVISLKYGVYEVKIEDKIFEVKARGALKKHHKLPIVGDHVLVNLEEKMIEDVENRRSLLKRPNIANLDQILLVFSLREPSFSYFLALKYITYANKYDIKTILILSKCDKDVPLEEINRIREDFKKIGIESYMTSTKTKEGLEEVSTLFKDKITSLVGQSGVGKSSLLNALEPRFKRKEGSYSEALGRGRHETKETVLLEYKDGYIADTPGFSSLDLELYKEEIAKFFPGMNKLYTDCYFHDCLHLSEKKCAIKKALEEGNIPQAIYDNYVKLVNDALPYNRRYDV